MESIEGVWQMINTESIAADGSALPPPYGGASGMGVIHVQNNRLTCVLCSTEPLSPGESPEYNSYCGPYTYDGKRLVTRVDASSNKDWIGTEQIRDVAFDNGILTLRPAEGTGPVDNGRRVLHWKKLPDMKRPGGMR